MNRRILITGTSRGIGQALAEHYLALGDSVVGCARSDSTVRHPRYTHHIADVTDEPSVRRLFTAVSEESRQLDALVNNAGIAAMNPVALTPLESARRIMETNFIGTFLFSHAAIRLFKSSGGGRIVNFTTIALPLRLEGEAIYAASKSAVETLTRIMAREVAGFGVTCNAVGPCLIKTRLTERLPAEKIDALLNRQAIPRWAEPADVANVIDFFLAIESRLVTGQVIYLGGLG